MLATPPEQALAAYSFADCADQGRQPFSTQQLTGYYEAWRDCGEGGTAIVTAALRPSGASDTVLVLAQIVEPSDLAALDAAFAGLRLGD